MNTNPLNHQEGMRWTDAAVVALVLTAATFFTVFLPTWSMEDIKVRTFEFAFACLQFIGAGFFTQFIALAGLHKLTEKKTEK